VPSPTWRSPRGGTDADDDRKLTGLAFHPSTFERRREAVDLFLEIRAAWPHSEEEVAARMKLLGNFDVWDGLAELRLPTLVLGGAEDRIVPPENGRRIAGRIPGAERVEIPETGHAFYLEEPEATNAALLDFMDGN